MCVARACLIFCKAAPRPADFHGRKGKKGSWLYLVRVRSVSQDSDILDGIFRVVLWDATAPYETADG